MLKDNKIWIGINGVKTFLKPEGNIQNFGNIGWYTNLEHSKRNEGIILYKQFVPEIYPTYDNYNAIEVSKVADIPCDYNGVMGVPITFLDKYNPNQFEIVGMAENEDLYKLKTRIYTSAECKQAYFDKFNKKGIYDLNATGVVIINNTKEKVFKRIFIRKINK